MSTKIKYHFLQSLFRFFSYWADKTNGWAMFVKPKLIIGSLIIGLGISSCTPEPDAMCYLPAPPPEVTCYDPVVSHDGEESIDSVSNEKPL